MGGEKADNVYKQTIKAKTVIDRVETAVEALNVSVNEFGYVNLAICFLSMSRILQWQWKSLQKGPNRQRMR